MLDACVGAESDLISRFPDPAAKVIVFVVAAIHWVKGPRLFKHFLADHKGWGGSVLGKDNSFLN
jgi:hypothetical protein